jgi:divalent metal cation (Fe/Co/Zn/Cd) transporter
VTDIDRPAAVRKGLLLNYFTIGYNVVEAVVSLLVGAVSGSIALISFGLDSVIEVTASLAAQWRLRADFDPVRRRLVERQTRRVIGASFLLLAAYVGYESIDALMDRESPERTLAGVAILTASVIVMPILARRKRSVAVDLGSRALTAEATQTSLCAYLSAIALAGVALMTFFGLWWADSLAALAMVPIIASEGIESIRGDADCESC